MVGFCVEYKVMGGLLEHRILAEETEFILFVEKALTVSMALYLVDVST